MRYYQIKGKLYPSVTTVLSVIRKPALEHWRGELGNEEADRQMNKAGSLGTRVHDLLEAVNLGLPWCSNDEAITRMVEAYENWFFTYVRKVIHVEKVVYNPLYGYAGRFDLVAVLKGDRKPSLIDFKTSNSLWPEMPLQLAAYTEALGGMKKIKRKIILHIDKNEPGKIVAKDAYEINNTDHDTDYQHFLYALSLFRYFNPFPAPEQNIIVKEVELIDCT